MKSWRQFGFYDNCQIVRSLLLPQRINYKFMYLSAYWQRNLANERARISAVMVHNQMITLEQVVILTYAVISWKLSYDWIKAPVNF